MPQFSPDQVTFKDIAGYGAWDVSHHREHLQFVQVLAQQTPPVLIPDFDFLSFLTAGQSQKSQLETHQQAHAMLRQITSVQGIDLSEVDLTNEDDFYNWLQYHATEHQAIRQALGVS